MREKKQWLIVTFYTTSAAMAAEKACGQAGLPGRIIPVPREITADCGLGWRTAPEKTPKRPNGPNNRRTLKTASGAD